MPTYEFRCRACGATFTQVRPMSESRAPASCPQGHEDTVRLLGVGGIALARPGAGARGASDTGSGGCCGGGCCA